MVFTLAENNYWHKSHCFDCWHYYDDKYWVLNLCLRSMKALYCLCPLPYRMFLIRKQKDYCRCRIKLIRTVPEVSHVLGKAGRANTATDNSPISMIETIIMLKPKNEWREGMTKDGIINELNSKLQIPGVTNGWTQPIINRINMLSTGIRTDVGLKVYGQNLDTIYAFAQTIKKQLEGIDGVKDLYVEPITGGKYIDIIVKREEIGRYGLSVDDVNTGY